MNTEQRGIRSAVRRHRAEEYMVTSLVAFAVTVIVTRMYLKWTGYPQIGTGVLHIAHALWGGLLLFVAVLLPLALANRWAIQASALLGGLGIGLFIDEVGKFITQANDYFYPPALSLIYGFFLLNCFIYLFFRRPHREDPRLAMYHVFEGLQDALDGDLDSAEAAMIEAQLAIAKRSDREEIVSLATVLSTFLEKEKERLPLAQPGVWKRTVARVDALGLRLGRRVHRTIISGILLLWLILVIGYVVVLMQGSPNLHEQVVQWRIVLLGIQTVIGCLMFVAVLAWFTRNEELGLKLAVSSSLLSLVGLQMHYFYISQFSAITSTLLQFGLLQILLAYRRWYLSG
jgi:sterol desaturase/sphingolipid hydroxylase (fatty acid hydroxylase superfamily)